MLEQSPQHFRRMQQLHRRLQKDNYVRHCRVTGSRLSTGKYTASQGSTSCSTQVHTHMPCRGTEPEAAGPLQGEGSGGVGGRVPSCPGTEGSYKACSSTGPSRQAGWQGDLLHSACQRVIPKARWRLRREGRAAGSCHSFHVVPLFLPITSGIREPEEGEEEEAERRAAASGSCREETEGGSQAGRGQAQGRVALPLESSPWGEPTVA